MNIRVTVTREDIQKADRAAADGFELRSYSCPIAQALKRRYPESNVLVTGWFARFDGGRYTLSQRAQDFIEAYDSGMGASPATFVLRED